MEPKEIFELIVKADERLKYSTASNAELRRTQATEFLMQALAEAQALGNEPLVEQARTRLRDLGAEM